jgi:hypothetical protein
MVLSRVSAGLQKIRRTLTDVFRGLKQKVLAKQKELKQPEKRRRQVRKERPLYLTHEQLKSERWGMAVLGKTIPGAVVARGCGAVMPDRRKITTGSVS